MRKQQIIKTKHLKHLLQNNLQLDNLEETIKLPFTHLSYDTALTAGIINYIVIYAYFCLHNCICS